MLRMGSTPQGGLAQAFEILLGSATRGGTEENGDLTWAAHIRPITTGLDEDLYVMIQAVY
jgi:hypothetical protein